MIKGHNTNIDATKTNRQIFLVIILTLCLAILIYLNTANNSVGINSKTAFMKLKFLKLPSK